MIKKNGECDDDDGDEMVNLPLILLPILINPPPPPYTGPAGPPVFKSDLREPVVAGSMLDLTCVSVGGHPPPTLRYVW